MKRAKVTSEQTTNTLNMVVYQHKVVVDGLTAATCVDRKTANAIRDAINSTTVSEFIDSCRSLQKATGVV